jgi:Fe-S-cluster containining protein
LARGRGHRGWGIKIMSIHLAKRGIISTMEDTHMEERRWTKLDLKKYGLESIEDKSPSTISVSDLNKLLEAFAAEDIAPAILGLSFTPNNVNELISSSHCRRCGNCCLPDPLDKNNPGVMVYDQDLMEIVKHSKYTYKYLLKKAPINKDLTLPQRRYLHLPCIFFTKGKCAIYANRPLVCKTYPITDTPKQDGISINVRCDYGKDIYKNAIKYIKRESFNSIIDKQFG